MVNKTGSDVAAAYTRTSSAWNDIKNWSNGQVVTYSFAGAWKSDSTGYAFFNGYTKSFSSTFSFNYKSAVKKAFAEWSDYANIEFVEVTDSGADIGRSAYADIRLSTAYIDGSSRYGPDTYAQTFFPDGSHGRGGDMVFDSANDSLWDYNSFYRVVLHEIGHAIGLAHSTNTSSVMHGVYDDSKNYLTYDDWQGARSIYGTQNNAPSVYNLASSETNLTILSGIRNMTVKGNSLSNKITGSDEAEKIFGKDNNDFLSGGNGFDLLDGGSGNDTLKGDTGNDTLLGSRGTDRLYGGWGEDMLDGGINNDLLYGNHGNDTLYGGSGKDTLFGGEGHDKLVGDDDVDFLYGDTGKDRLYGGDANDRLYGGSGKDRLYGGDADDRISGGSQNDILVGNDGDDLLIGGSSDDLLKGGNHADRLLGESGNDSLYGGSGDDTLAGGSGSNYLEGGSGTDTVDYSWGKSRIDVNLNSGTAKGIAHDTLFNIENIIGTSYYDTLIGNEENNILSGENGNDSLDGYRGNDTLFGGSGRDTLIGSSGSDFLDGGANNDRLYGGSGNDTLIGGSGSNILNGGSGQDLAIFSGAASDYTVVVNGTTTTVTENATGDTNTLQYVEEISYTFGNFVSTITADENDGASAQLLAAGNNNSALTFELVDGPALGSITIDSNGDYTYSSEGDFEALAEGETSTTSFTYGVSDGTKDTEQVVTISVNGVNDNPIVSVEPQGTLFLSSPIKVNQGTAEKAHSPSIAQLSDGKYVVSWTLFTKPNITETFFRLYNADSTPHGDAIKTFAEDDLGFNNPQILATQNGFVIAARGDSPTSSTGPGLQVFIQRYDNDGQEIGTREVFDDFNYYDVELSALDGDDFVVVFEPNNWQEQEGLNIEGVVFDSVNETYGSIFDVSQDNSRTQSAQSSENIITLSNGKFVITWTSDTTPGDNNSVGVSARIFNSDGSPATDEFTVNQEIEFHQYSSALTQLSNGNILFVFKNYYNYDISYWGREFDADGNPTGDEFKIDFSKDIYGLNDLQIIAFPAGGYMIVASLKLSSGNQLIGRQYDNNHEAVSDFFQISSIEYSPDKPDLSLSAEGNVLVTWEVTNELNGVKFRDVFTREITPQRSTEYDEGDVPLSLLSTVSLSDVDSATLDGATISITSGYSTGDTLAITLPAGSGIVAIFDEGTGILTLSGAASLTDYETALSSVTFENTQADSVTGEREISIQVDDGASENNLSNVATVTVTVVESNDAPVPVTTAITANEDTGTSGQLTATDSESDTLSFELVSGPDRGSITIDSDGAYTYTSDNDFEGLAEGQTSTTSFTYSVSDGTDNVEQEVTVSVDGVNDAPIVSLENSDSFSLSPATKVNQGVEEKASSPGITQLSDGNHVVTWTLDTSPNIKETYFRIYNGDGTPKTEALKAFAEDDQNFNIPQILATDNGFVIAARGDMPTSSGGPGLQVFVQRYDNDGQEVGTREVFNEYLYYDVELTALEGDDFVVVFEPKTWQGPNIEAVVFDATSETYGSIFDVSQFNTGRQSGQVGENIITLSNGKFVITWSSETTPGDGSSMGVSARIFNSDGSPATDEFRVNQATESYQYSKALTQLSSGNILFVYTNYTDQNGYWGREFDENGTPAGDEFEIDFSTEGYSEVNEVQIIALPAGGYMVVARADLGSDTQLIGRQYDNAHNAVSDFFQIADIQDHYVFESDEDRVIYTSAQPNVSLSAEDSVLVTWQVIDRHDGARTIDIYSREITLQGSANEYGDGDSPLSFLSSVSLSDVDSATLDGATISISNGYSAGDTLAITIPAGSDIVASFDDSTGILTLSGTASLTDYETALSSVTFENTQADPDTGEREISIQVDDGASENNVSNIATVTVTVVGPNDAPVPITTAITANEDTGTSGQLTATDNEGSDLSFELVSDPDQGSITIDSDGAYNFDTDDNFEDLAEGETATTSFTYSVSDGTDNVEQAVTVSVDGVNDAPIVSLESSVVLSLSPTTKVNQGVEEKASSPGITQLSDGNHVVTWTLYSSPNIKETYFRIYNGDGTPETEAIKTFAEVDQNFNNPQILATETGFVIAARGDTPTSSMGPGRQVFVQRYDNNGQEVGTREVFDDYTYYDVEMSALEGDDFVVVLEPNNWEDVEDLNIEAVVFDAASETYGSIFDVSEDNAGTQSGQSSENIITLSNGKFIISWSSATTPGDESSMGASARIFNSDGSPATDEFRVNQATNSYQYLKTLTQLSSGNILFVYSNYTDQLGYWGREFDENGTPAGDEFEIDFTTEGYSEVSEVQIIALPAGGYMVVARADLGSDTQLIGRQYDNAHNAVTDFFQIADIQDPYADEFDEEMVNHTSALPNVSLSAEGNVLVTWQVEDSDQHKVNSIDVYTREITLQGDNKEYDDGDSPLSFLSNASLSDVDSTTLDGATISISSGYSAGDTLAITLPAGSDIVASFDNSTGILTLSGTASLTDYETALSSVTFENTQADPDTGEREISIQVDDGASENNLSNVATMTVTVVDTGADIAAISKIVEPASPMDISTVFEELQSDIDAGEEIVDLDVLFDELGIGGPEVRADLVESTSDEGGTLLIIDHETLSEYSLSLPDLDLGDHAAGSLSVADLMTSGIDVGDES